MVRPFRRLAVVLVLGLVACGGEAGSTSGSVASPPATPSTTSPAGSGLPRWAGQVDVDVDGDGLLDAVAVIEDGDEVLLGVRLSSGETVVSPLDPSPLVEAAVRAVGRIGDGVGIFVLIDRGASTDVHQMYTWSDGRLEPVSSPSGVPAVFPVGAAVTHSSGVECRPGGVAVLSAESTDGETFVTTTVEYRLEGATLVETGRSTGTMSSGDPGFGGFSDVVC